MALFLLGLVLSIPLSIVANLTTPWIKTWFAKRSLYRTQARIDEISRQSELIKEYRTGSSRSLIAFVGTRITFLIHRYVFALLFNLGFVIYGTTNHGGSDATSIAFAFCAIFSLFWAVFASVGALLTFRNIDDFQRYQRKTEQQLKELRGKLQVRRDEAQRPT